MQRHLVVKLGGTISWWHGEGLVIGRIGACLPSGMQFAHPVRKRGVTTPDVALIDDLRTRYERIQDAVCRSATGWRRGVKPLAGDRGVKLMALWEPQSTRKVSLRKESWHGT